MLDRISFDPCGVHRQPPGHVQSVTLPGVSTVVDAGHDLRLHLSLFPESTMFALTLFGPPNAALDDRSLLFPTVRSRALLAYLALHPQQPQFRDALAELLWAGGPGAENRSNLRTALSRLRRTLKDVEQPLVRADRDTITFIGPAGIVDVLRFRSLLRACANHAHRSELDCQTCLERMQEAVALPAGPLLAGLHLAGNPLFEEWLLAEREQCQQQVLSALQTLVKIYQQRQDHAQVVTYARQQLALAPWREETHLALMRAYLLNGERHRALQHYATMTD